MTIRNPMPSPMPSVRCVEPEMTSASFGSATRHMSLNRPIKARIAARTIPATTPIAIGNAPLSQCRSTLTKASVLLCGAVKKTCGGFLSPS